MKTGKLFVFEGADEVGKTTLATMLAKALDSKCVSCDIVGFPGNEVGTLGRHVYELHHNPGRFRVNSINPASLQILHVAAHIDAIDARIIPALRRNRTVILDRFWWSTWIYGVIGGADKPSLRAAIRAEALHWMGISPTRLFLITCSTPFERQASSRQWKQTSALYKMFAAQERRKYPISVITNNSTPEAAFARVQRCLHGS